MFHRVQIINSTRKNVAVILLNFFKQTLPYLFIRCFEPWALLNQDICYFASLSAKKRVNTEHTFTEKTVFIMEHSNSRCNFRVTCSSNFLTTMIMCQNCAHVKYFFRVFVYFTPSRVFLAGIHEYLISWKITKYCTAAPKNYYICILSIVHATARWKHLCMISKKRNYDFLVFQSTFIEQRWSAWMQKSNQEIYF